MDADRDLGERRLLYAILHHLHERPAFVTDAAAWSAAVAALERASGISGTADSQRYALVNAGHEVTLRSIFQVAAESVSGGAAARPANAPHAAAAPVKDAEELQAELVPEALREKFRHYLGKLKSTIYFKDVEDGSDAWNKRLVKAREKFMRKYGGAAESASAPVPASASTSTPAAAAPPQSRSPPSADSVARADALKNAGNELLKTANYQGAVDRYTEAIALNATNPVYYSNRAAAYQYLNRHDLALADSQEAVRLDPAFVKGYMRIGHSLVALGRHQDGIDQGFRKVLELQPGDAGALEGIAAAEAQLDVAGNLMRNPAVRQMAEQVQGAGGLGGLGGGGGLGDLLNNPNLMNMAMNAMNDPQMAGIFNNPMFQNLAQQAMQNPDMLRNMMGGMFPGGAPGAAPPAAAEEGDAPEGGPD